MAGTIGTINGYGVRATFTLAKAFSAEPHVMAIYNLPIGGSVTIPQSIYRLVARDAQRAIQWTIIGCDVINRYQFHLMIRRP